MTNNSFSIRLREARLMMGLSMDKLVVRTNGAITKHSISRYEKGIMRPKRDALHAIFRRNQSQDRCSDAPYHLQW